MPTDPKKKGSWISQKWCLVIVRHVFMNIFWDRNAWQFAVQKSIDQLDDCQAAFLGESGIFFGIVRHLFGIARHFLPWPCLSGKPWSSGHPVGADGSYRKAIRNGGLWKFLTIRQIYPLSNQRKNLSAKKKNSIFPQDCPKIAKICQNLPKNCPKKCPKNLLRTFLTIR